MKPRTAGVIVALAGLAWFVSNRAPGQSAPVVAPAGDGGGVTGWANMFIDAVAALAAKVTTGVGWAVAHPIVPAVVVGLIVIGLLVHLVRSHRPVVQDPQRMYTSEQRKESFGYAGGQCEYTGKLLTRCRKPAEHADHLFPWSKGGATSIANCCASCATHNLSKGANILPSWRVRLLVHRRKRYYPAGVDRACGQMFTERYASSAPVASGPPRRGVTD